MADIALEQAQIDRLNEALKAAGTAAPKVRAEELALPTGASWLKVIPCVITFVAAIVKAGKVQASDVEAFVACVTKVLLG